jgi:hypothetical protein
MLFLLKLIPKVKLKQFGYLPVDRFYINEFLRECVLNESFSSKGRSLEFGEVRYSRFFPGEKFKWIYSSNFVIINHEICGDILSKNSIEIKFDLIVSTQVITFVENPKLYLHNLCELLSPGGLIVLTSPGIGVFTSKYDAERWGDFGRYSLRSLNSFIPEGFYVSDQRLYGNFDVLRKLNNNISVPFIKKEKLLNHVPNEEVLIGLIIRRRNA